MAPRLDVKVSESVWAAVQRQARMSGDEPSKIVDRTLAEAFALERHSLFQVSTSNALVQGVFGGVITVGDLRAHGDFGLGTFAGLDGELVMVDGSCFRATAGGVAAPADDAREVPFALVTRFGSDVQRDLAEVSSLLVLEQALDDVRPSENLFAGIRVDGAFDGLMMRAACPAREGEGLLDATRHQSEFHAGDITGTLVGFWAPRYSKAVSVPGYHFHFISEDRILGGHVLDLRAGAMTVQLQVESDLHLAIPETAEFLAADLSGEHESELAAAESERRSG